MFSSQSRSGFSRGWGWLPVALIVLGATAWVYAQTPATPTDTDIQNPPSAQTSEAEAPPAQAASPGSINLKTGALPTTKQLFMFSPYINGLIVILSIIAVILFLYFLLTINGRAMVPSDLVEEATRLVMRGKYEAASDLCRVNRRVFIAPIIQRCVENAGKGQSVLMSMIEAEGQRRADVVWNRLSYLSDVANVAPMLGLLGTVVGMIKAFFLVQYQDVSATSKALSAGVGGAMSTTMFGLIVAIAALVFYSIIKARATRVLANAEQAVHSIADHIEQAAAGAVEDENSPSTISETGPAATPSPRAPDVQAARAVVGGRGA